MNWLRFRGTDGRPKAVTAATPLPTTATVTSVTTPTGASATQVQGTVAHDSPAANNPVLSGGTACDPDNPPANVTAADVVKLLADLKGRLLVWVASKLDPTNDSVSIGSSATSAGSLDTFRSVSATNTAAAVKAAAGRVHGVHIKNRHNADIYVHFYDAATGNVTPAATTPKQSFCVLNGSVLDKNFTCPIGFATAITIVVCTEPNPEVALAATAPATLPVINIGYK